MPDRPININRDVRSGTTYQAPDDQTVADDLSVTDDLAITDDLTVGGDATVTGAAAITGAVTFGDTLLSDVQQTETVAVDKTLDAGDSGVFQIVTVDAKVITLPATVLGLTYTIINGGADGAVLVTVSPNASDKIAGAGLTAADNKDLLNTKATAKKGDMVRLFGDGVDGWFVQEIRGTWAREG